MAEPANVKLHHYQDYAWLRGFNIVSSWGARIEQAWWDYSPDRFREEAALANQTHANCIRLWIEFTAWMADPDAVHASFMDAVAAIDELGMRTMPCLFNRWHAPTYDYGGTYIDDLHRNWSPKLAYGWAGACGKARRFLPVATAMTATASMGRASTRGSTRMGRCARAWSS